jgi:hypothetical protein
MLEWERNRSGTQIPKWNGNLLASRVDPVREAKQWVERLRPSMHGLSSAFILGVGGGFHVAELAREFPRVHIVAIDFVKELIENLQTNSGGLANVCPVYLENPNEIFSRAAIVDALRASFIVAKHPASSRCFQNQIRDLERNLLGRDPRSFYAHLQARPDDMDFFSRISFPAIRNRGLVEIHNNKPVTVKSITSHIEVPMNEQGMIWMALAELVK